MTKRTAEDLVAEWEKSGVATVNLDELKALIASWRKRGEALKNLVDRLDEINAHPEFKSVWTLHHVHGGRYGGPNWVEPLEAARAALKEGEG